MTNELFLGMLDLSIFTYWLDSDIQIIAGFQRVQKAEKPNDWFDFSTTTPDKVLKYCIAALKCKTFPELCELDLIIQN